MVCCLNSVKGLHRRRQTSYRNKSYFFFSKYRLFSASFTPRGTTPNKEEKIIKEEKEEEPITPFIGLYFPSIVKRLQCRISCPIS